MIALGNDKRIETYQFFKKQCTKGENVLFPSKGMKNKILKRGGDVRMIAMIGGALIFAVGVLFGAALTRVAQNDTENK